MRRAFTAKRVFDLALALPLLVATTPLSLLVAVAVAAGMGRPVLFRQPRIGLGEKVIHVHKFRTMNEKRGADGEPLPDAVRLTRLGRFLRRTSLDELPQLLDVLRGELSFVGPRPLLLRYLPFYTERERLRHTVLPGITGWAQIHGRNEASWDERLARDVWYVEHRSLGLDLRILWRTASAVLGSRGVVEDPRSIMLNFDEERVASRGSKPDKEAPG